MSYTMLKQFHTMLPREAVPATPQSLKNLKVGDFVKIGVECANGRTEKFWLKVEELGHPIRCTINQDLMLTRYHLLKCDDEIWIQEENINGVMKGGL